MVEHAGFLAYLWFLVGNLGALWEIILKILTMILVIWYSINTISTGGVSWLFMDKNENTDDNVELENAIRNRPKLFLLTKIFLIMVVINVIVPTRNQTVVIFSATPMIKSGIDVSKKISDNNTTKSIGVILNNSLEYLEKKSNDLNK